MDEKYLYHGTNKSNIESILNDDFSLTINSMHGRRYGKGIYFTDDLELALSYSEKKENKKYVFVCKVYVGYICPGNYSMDKLPINNNTNMAFDTAVDNIFNPHQFIKFKNHQYLIIGLLEIDIFNKLHPKYIPQNEEDKKLITNFKNTKPYAPFNAKLKIYYKSTKNNINVRRQIYWKNGLGSLIRIQIPKNGGFIHTNIGCNFIIKNSAGNVINKIFIVRSVMHYSLD